MSSGTGLSGSTAWNASVRSRPCFERVTDEGYAADLDARRLTNKKANHGRTGEKIILHWKGGAFVADEAPAGLDRMAANAKAERVFLTLLDAFNLEGRKVRHTTGNGCAPAAFAKSGRAEGVGKAALHAAMESLFRQGVIEVAEEGPPSRRSRHLKRAEK